MGDQLDPEMAASGTVPLLALEGVSKRYGAVLAVDGVDMAIGAGQFVTLLGPSGSGKTTCLNMIAGFETPDSGGILLRGDRINELPPYRRQLNTVFQGYALFPHLDVKGNVAFGLRMRRVGKDEIRTRVAQALEMVHLTPMADRPVDKLSGGQQQRVALARALVNRPQLVLLDEPLSALDAQLRKSMQAEFKSVQQQTGLTFVYVTHDQEEALVLSDRIYLMHAGRIEQEGSPSDLYDRPASRFAAEFIGRNNLLSGEVVDDRGMTYLAVGEGVRLRLGTDVGQRRGPAVVAVRPEALALSDAPGETTVPATLVTTRFLGDRVEAHLRVPTGEILSLFVDPQALPADGEVHVSVPPDRCTVLWEAP